jgi:hypothetical protein
MSLLVVHSILSNSKVLGGWRRWRWGDLVDLGESVGTSKLPRISLACCILFDIFFVGRAAAGGGQLLSEGIQLVTDVVMLPLCPQRTTRWSSLGIQMLWGEGLGIIGGQHGVVVSWMLGELLGGFSLGRASQNPGLGSQAEGRGLFSWQTFPR